MKSFNDSSFIKEEEYDKSFVEENEENNNINNTKDNNKIILSDDIEREEDKRVGSYYPNKYTSESNNKYNKYKYNKDNNYNNINSNNEYKSANNLSYNKAKTPYYNNNSNSNSNLNNVNNNYKYNNNINRVNNNSNYYKYNSTTISSNNISNLNNNNYYKKFNSSSNNNLSNNNINNNQKIILNNLKLFKRHIDSKKYINKFNWDEIHNMIVYDKIGMNYFIEQIVKACFEFNINKQSMYYIDLYIKSIFDYYKEYFDDNDVIDIKDTIVKNLENLYSEQIINYYLEDVWTCVLYYLIDNQILTISDFNIFNRNSNNIKKEVANLLTKIIDYNRDTKKILINELKASKYYNENRKLFEKY